MKKIQLFGYNEELHDKITCKKGDFKKQINNIKKKQKKTIDIKFNKLNFYCIDKIITFALRLKKEKIIIKQPFSVKPLNNILNNWNKQINKYKQKLRKNNISITTNNELIELLDNLQKKSNEQDENDLLRLLGIISETIFIGPNQLLLDINNRCNTECVYCWIHSPHIKKKTYSMDQYKKPKEISFEIFKRIIDDATKIGVEDIVMVGDGEPTIHSQFNKLIKYINKKGLSTMLFSNGLTFNEKKIKAIVDNNVGTLQISISAATPKTYIKLHPSTKKQEFMNLKKNIKKLAKYKHKKKNKRLRIVIVNVINNLNYHELVKMTNFAWKVGANEVGFQLIDLRDYSMYLKLSKEQITRVKKDFKKIRLLTKIYYLLSFGKFFVGHHLDRQLENINFNTGDWSENVYTKRGCFIGWWFAYYRLNDIFTFCCSIKEVEKLKHLRFKDIWFSDNYNKFRIAGKYLKENKDLEFKDGRKLFESKCNNCDNTGHLNKIQRLIKEFELEKFVFNKFEETK